MHWFPELTALEVAMAICTDLQEFEPKEPLVSPTYRNSIVMLHSILMVVVAGTGAHLGKWEINNNG